MPLNDVTEADDQLRIRSFGFVFSVALLGILIAGVYGCVIKEFRPTDGAIVLAVVAIFGAILDRKQVTFDASAREVRIKISRLLRHEDILIPFTDIADISFQRTRGGNSGGGALVLTTRSEKRHLLMAMAASTAAGQQALAPRILDFMRRHPAPAGAAPAANTPAPVAQQ